MDLTILNDTVSNVIAGLTVGGVVAVWRKAVSIDKKFNELELELAKEYATKEEFKILSDKIDRSNELLATKIDTLNSNMLQLFRIVPNV